MYMNNFATLTGHLGGDPEIRYFESGKCVAKFSIAVSTGKDKPADWFECQCWNKSAERAIQRLSKGSRVVVSGSLKQERWADRETGAQRSKVILSAESIEIIERAPQQPQQPAQQPQQPVAAGAIVQHANYDDIPF